jgi:hypothetical protein
MQHKQLFMVYILMTKNTFNIVMLKKQQHSVRLDDLLSIKFKLNSLF